MSHLTQLRLHISPKDVLLKQKTHTRYAMLQDRRQKIQILTKTAQDTRWKILEKNE